MRGEHLSVTEPIVCCAPLTASSLTDAEAETLARVFSRLQNERATEPGSVPEQRKGAQPVAGSTARPTRRSLPSGSAAGSRSRRTTED